MHRNHKQLPVHLETFIGAYKDARETLALRGLLQMLDSGEDGRLLERYRPRPRLRPVAAEIGFIHLGDTEKPAPAENLLLKGRLEFEP